MEFFLQSEDLCASIVEAITSTGAGTAYRKPRSSSFPHADPPVTAFFVNDQAYFQIEVLSAHGDSILSTKYVQKNESNRFRLRSWTRVIKFIFQSPMHVSPYLLSCQYPKHHSHYYHCRHAVHCHQNAVAVQVPIFCTSCECRFEKSLSWWWLRLCWWRTVPLVRWLLIALMWLKMVFCFDCYKLLSVRSIRISVPFWFQFDFATTKSAGCHFVFSPNRHAIKPSLHKHLINSRTVWKSLRMEAPGQRGQINPDRSNQSPASFSIKDLPQNWGVCLATISLKTKPS